jgi:putative PIN family toxin of toxin-antitoxin system
MRVVADTNIVVSGLFWRGPPRQVLDLAAAGTIKLFTTSALLAELEDVLEREKFRARIAAVGSNPHELTLGYAALASSIIPAPIEAVVIADPDDDAVLACAVAAQAAVIVSGDRHLLELKQYRGVEILTAVELLARLSIAPVVKKDVTG